MAEKTIVERIDDLDESTGDVTTIEFGLDGVTYEIDLSATNADALRNSLAQFVAAGRKKKSSGSTPARRGSGSTSAEQAKARKAQLAEIREWARANGFPVADQGRVAADIIGSWKKWKASGNSTNSGAGDSGSGNYSTAGIPVPQFSGANA